MQDILSNKKKKGKLEPSYPEFYEKLKDLKIAILPLNPKGVITKKYRFLITLLDMLPKNRVEI